MPELRLNPITREWVIISTERAKRPTDFKSPGLTRPSPPPYLHSCPFCVGNESKTGEERYKSPKDGNWNVRVVANKFPVLSGDGVKLRKGDPLLRSVTAVGVHEIIVESPLHDQITAKLSVEHIAELVRTYRARFISASKDPRVEHVIIFKNSGEGAGTTIVHPHTQIIATPIVPIQFRDRVRSAMHYFDDTGDCVYCAVLKRELNEGARVVKETEGFITFVPYAALSQFHTWIFPKRHAPSFAGITDAEIEDFAGHVKSLLLKFYYALENPDFNFVIRSSRPVDETNEYCHWYFTIMPRVSKIAGFELGSGIFINSSLPEESAEFLRGARVTE